MFTVGTAVTILSAAVSGSCRKHPLEILILDCERDAKGFTRLELWLGPYMHLVKLRRIVVPSNALDHLRPKLRGSLTTYARLLIPDLISSDDAIYLDSDLLVLKNLDDLPKPSKPNILLTAVLDPGFLCLGNDRPIYHNTDADCDEKLMSLPYFNAGVLRFNPNQWKERHIAKRALEMIRDTTCRAWDQTALNHTLADTNGEISFIHPSWNLPRQLWREKEITTEETIYHFIGASKPWLRYYPESGYALWHTFFNIFFKTVHPQLREEQQRIRSIRRRAMLRIAGAPIMMGLHAIRARIAPSKNIRSKSLDAVRFWREVWQNGKTSLIPSSAIKEWRQKWRSSASPDISKLVKDP